MTSICYFGAYDPAYPRNLLLRRGLQAAGMQVTICNVSRNLLTIHKVPELLSRFRTLDIHPDVILLAEFGQALAPLAWWVARRSGAKLVVDAFTSVYDSAVGDRATARPRTPTALRYRLIDWVALYLADLILTDTGQHSDYYVRGFGISPDKIAVIPIGATREWFLTPDASAENEELLVQFYGSYIPLHGVEIILQAMRELRRHPGLRFELIGRGQTYGEARALADKLKLTDVVFREPVLPEELPAVVARADISLGIFGTTPKAARVIPNKVCQTLALGKPVITADTLALRENFIPGEHLLAVPPGNPDALAEAIVNLAEDPALRSRLGWSGRAQVASNFTEEALGQQLAARLEMLCG